MTTKPDAGHVPTPNGNNIHPLLNKLVQLQEFTLVRAQHEAASADKHLDLLDTTIQSLLDSLDEEVRQLFIKIQKKDQLAIVPISNNVCSGCGLTLPVSLVYAVRAAEKLHQCTNCARILYYPDVRPRRLSKKTGGRFEPRRPGIARFSSATLMVPQLKASDRNEAIAELATLLVDEGFVDNLDKLIETGIQRDVTWSTSFNNGLAMPHAREIEGGGLTLALGINRKGIRWIPEDRTLTHIVVFSVIPTAASVFYQRLLAGISETFGKKSERDKLMAAKTPDELWACLVKATRNTIK